MKKVMVYAYTAFNLGDDLFIKILCERYPDTTFLLVAPRAYKKVFHNIPNLKIYSRESIIRRALNITIQKTARKYHFTERLLAKTCDATVYIGGSLFMQQQNWRKQLQQTKALQTNDQPFYLLGANFGPFVDQTFYTAHEQIFQTYEDVCFRDHHSYELFHHLKNVRLADDIIFQLKQPTATPNPQSVVISVIKPSIRRDLAHYDDIYYEAIKKLALHFIKKDYDVTFIAFCTEEKDDIAIDEIIQQIPQDYHHKIKRHVYQYQIHDALETMNRASLIIATRLHAMLLGWLFNKRVLPVIYNEKMTQIINDRTYEGPSITFDQLESLSEQTISQMIEQVAPYRVSNDTSSSEKQFAELDKLLHR